MQRIGLIILEGGVDICPMLLNLMKEMSVVVPCKYSQGMKWWSNENNFAKCIAGPLFSFLFQYFTQLP